MAERRLFRTPLSALAYDVLAALDDRGPQDPRSLARITGGRTVAVKAELDALAAQRWVVSDGDVWQRTDRPRPRDPRAVDLPAFLTGGYLPARERSIVLGVLAVILIALAVAAGDPMQLLLFLPAGIAADVAFWLRDRGRVTRSAAGRTA